MPLYVVTDLRTDPKTEEQSEDLVGIFTTEKKARDAIRVVKAEWKLKHFGKEDGLHVLGYFEFDGIFDRVTIPSLEIVSGADEYEEEGDEDSEEEEGDEDGEEEEGDEDSEEEEDDEDGEEEEDDEEDEE